MRQLYHNLVGNPYHRACWLLDDEQHIIDCYGDLQDTEWVLTLYIETIADKGQYERDVYYYDEAHTVRIATRNLTREFVTTIPSWEHFLENVESYVMLAALS